METARPIVSSRLGPAVTGYGVCSTATCGEVGFVHLLFGEVRVTAALKVVEEVQEGLQEIENE